MDRRQKRMNQNPPDADASEERPQPSRARRSRSSSASIERLTEIMADFIKSTDNRKAAVAAKGEVVPIFNPEDKDQNAVTWCKKVDELSEVFNWSEEATIYFALSKLRGLAEVWYKSLPTIKFTWDQWKEKIQTAFPSRMDYHEMLGDMMRRRKHSGETYAKYFYEKLALLTRCKIFEAEAVSCIIGGIDDVVIKTGAKAGNHQTPEALYQYLSSVNDSSVLPSRDNFIRHKTKMVSYNKSHKRDKHHNVKCFRCGKLGHMANACNQVAQKELRCGICRYAGHAEKDCRFKKTSSTVVA